MHVISIGTSGWTYDHWRGVFYPEDIPKTRWLEFYCRAFSTVEVNATFYRHMKPSTVEKWEQNTPEDFCWSIKANRLITHIKRLRGVHEPLERFLSSVAPLGEKLGPILFQLPPSLAFDEGLLMTFLSLIPKHFHCALEARNRSWVNERAFSCLHQHKVAWCISDTAGRYPCYEELTADFVYLRLHGSKKLYASSYTEDELAAWAARIKGWERDTYAYFDNDFMGYAPNNALKLKALLGADISGISPG